MPRDPARALASVYGRIDEVADGLDEDDYDARTGCAAYTVKDLLFHLLLDAQRALIALAAPLDEAPDTDALTYWQKYAAAAQRPAREAQASPDRFVQRAALAYQRPSGLVRHWRDTSAAAVAAAKRSDPAATVATQGHLIAVPDFLRTLVVEAVIHLWDLTVQIQPGDPDVPEDALAITRTTLEGLLGTELPAAWSVAEWVLKTTGRAPLGDADRAALGEAAGRVPVIS